jgi:uncharacterized protein YjiK
VPNPRFPTGFLLLAGLAGACDPDPSRAARKDSTLLAQREARLSENLARSDSSSRAAPLARWELPHGLREISGLALSPDGRLFAHDDNNAVVYQIDYRRGAIVKQFQLGDKLVQGDFEAITVAGDRMYLLTSDGILYRFPEGDDHSRVAYNEIDTGLGKKCEFEAMTYEAAGNALILACKTVYQKSLGHELVLYRWGLPNGEPLTRMTVSEDVIVGKHDDKGELHPTDITVDPASGHLVVLTKDGHLIELMPDGSFVAVHKLPDRHHQPEGLAITADGFVLVSDEAGPRPASITAYHGIPKSGGK